MNFPRTEYGREMRRCRLALLLNAVIEHGSQQAAAEACGIHRNTLSRALRAGGYDYRQLKSLVELAGARMRRKPVQRAHEGPAEERRVA